MADLKDCGRFSVGVGPGIDAVAKVGCLVHPSIGLGSHTLRVGQEDRFQYGVWEETQIVWPVELLFQDLGKGWGGGAIPLASYERHPPELERSWFPVLQELAFHDLTDLEAGGTILFVSVRAGINPLEIIDFVLGFIGVDIAKDDPKTKDAEKPTRP
jgi:hypothetical protein